jgi:hypothetical protein
MLCALSAPITATLFAIGGFDAGQNIRQDFFELERQGVPSNRAVVAHDALAQGNELLQSYPRALHN